MTDLAADWATVHERVSNAVDHLHVRAAARRIATFAATLPRITVKLTEHFDWDRLRVNVATLVAPDLVKWR
jgi:hypothetical protein